MYDICLHNSERNLWEKRPSIWGSLKSSWLNHEILLKSKKRIVIQSDFGKWFRKIFFHHYLACIRKKKHISIVNRMETKIAKIFVFFILMLIRTFVYIRFSKVFYINKRKFLEWANIRNIIYNYEMYYLPHNLFQALLILYQPLLFLNNFKKTPINE